MIATVFRMRRARKVMSSRFPMGVLTTYSEPAIGSPTPDPKKRSAVKTALLRKDHEFYAKISARSPKFMESICAWYVRGVREGDEYAAEAAGRIDHRRWHRHRTCDKRSLS